MTTNLNDAIIEARNIISTCTFSRLNEKLQEPPFYNSVSEDITADVIMSRPQKNPTQLNTLQEYAQFPDVLYNMYHLLDSNKREFTYNTFVFFSIDEVLERHEGFIRANQKNICDIACKYYGLGHVIVLSWNKAARCFMLRRDGGSNDHDRINNYQFIINYRAESIDENKKLPTNKVFKILRRCKLEILRDMFVNDKY